MLKDSPIYNTEFISSIYKELIQNSKKRQYKTGIKINK